MKEKIIKYLNQTKTLEFRELLFHYIDRSGLKDSDVYNSVGLDRRLFSKIRCDSTYIPRKTNILKICISLKLDISDSNHLLASAGYILSTSDEIDLVFSYFIENKIYDIDLINQYLYSTYNTVI